MGGQERFPEGACFLKSTLLILRITQRVLLCSGRCGKAVESGAWKGRWALLGQLSGGRRGPRPRGPRVGTAGGPAAVSAATGMLAEKS